VVSRFEGGEQLGAQPSGGKAASIRVWISARRLLAPAEPGTPLPRHGQGTAWRIELVAGRWQLSRYSPAGDTWQRVGSYPTRYAAIDAAYSAEDGTSTSR